MANQNGGSDKDLKNKVIVSSKPKKPKTPEEALKPQPEHEVMTSPVDDPSLSIDIPQDPTSRLTQPKEPNMTEPTGTPVPQKPSMFPSLLSVVALGAVLVLGWFVYTFHESVKQDKLALEANTQAIQQLVARLDNAPDVGAQLAKTTSEIQSQSKLFKDQLDAQNLRLSQMGQNQNWMAFEARYLIQLAEQRLAAFQDVTTAKVLLEASDQRLKTLSSSQAMNAREAIMKDLSALGAFEQQDVVGLWAQLGALEEGIGRLKFHTQAYTLAKHTEEPLAQEEQEGWRASLSNSLTELKGLVKVHDLSDAKENAVLSGTQQFNLTHGVLLMVEQARWAVINQNQALYEASLERVGLWLSEYYEMGDALSSTLNQVDELKAINLDVEVPNLSRSVAAIDAYLAQEVRS